MILFVCLNSQSLMSSSDLLQSYQFSSKEILTCQLLTSVVEWDGTALRVLDQLVLL